MFVCTAGKFERKIRCQRGADLCLWGVNEVSDFVFAKL